MKFNLHIFVAAIIVLLSGCTGLSPDRYLSNKQTFMLNQGNPPAYVLGYIEGCSSGRRLAGDKRFAYRKNTIRFDKDALYARGWQEAQINCRNESLAEALKVPAVNGRKDSDPSSANTIEAQRHRRVEAESRAAEAEMREIWEELKK